MINQTTIPIESTYPTRSLLCDDEVSWEVELPSYQPPLHPQATKTIDLLAAHGIDVQGQKSLSHLITLSNRQAAEVYGDAVLNVRHPLGRTGINGTGIFWGAGESATSDFAALRRGEMGLEIALIFNRNRWGLPGGFCDNDVERAERRLTGMREVYEETNLDVYEFADEIITVVPLHVKPRSKRSVDFGYITNQVDALLVPMAGFGDNLKARDDAEAAAWFTFERFQDLCVRKSVSPDHERYISDTFSAFWGD